MSNNNLGKLGNKNAQELTMLGVDEHISNLTGSLNRMFTSFSNDFSDNNNSTTNSISEVADNKSLMGMVGGWIVIVLVVGLWGYKMNFDQFEQNEIMVGSAMALLLFGAIRPILLNKKFDLKVAILITFMYTIWYFFTYIFINYGNKDRYKNLIYK